MYQVNTQSDASCVCLCLSDSWVRRHDLPAVDTARQQDQHTQFKMAVYDSDNDGDEYKVTTDWTKVAIPYNKKKLNIYENINIRFFFFFLSNMNRKNIMYLNVHFKQKF